MLSILYLSFNTKTLVLYAERTYDCTSGMMIPYLMYQSYAKMDVWFR